MRMTIAANAGQSHRRRDGVCELFVDANLFFLSGSGRNHCKYQFTIREVLAAEQNTRSGTQLDAGENPSAALLDCSERVVGCASGNAPDTIAGCRIRPAIHLSTPPRASITAFRRLRPGPTSFPDTRLLWMIPSSPRFVLRPGCRILEFCRFVTCRIRTAWS